MTRKRNENSNQMSRPAPILPQATDATILDAALRPGWVWRRGQAMGAKRAWKKRRYFGS